jgi:hypothetical protein
MFNKSFAGIIAGGLMLGNLVSCKKTTGTTSPEPLPAADITIGLKAALPSVLKESSGLCFTGGNLWSFGDSGNLNAIYSIDSATGAVLQVVIIKNFPNVDYEAMTADSACIYVSDAGNNYGDRRDLKILRIKKADIVKGPNIVSVEADAINFTYADQKDFEPNTNTNFDCEAIASIGSYLYLFSKDRGDLQTRCYRLAKDTGTYSIAPIATFNSGGKVTDAAYNPTTNELALLGYMNKDRDSFIWFFNGYTGDNFFSGSTKRENIGSANVDWQTEGLTYISGNRLLLSCETSTSHLASLYFVQKQ